MFKNRSHVFVLLIGGIAIFLLACETANMIQALASRPTDLPTRTQVKGTPTRAPNGQFDFVAVGTPHCASGDEAESIVSGRITRNDEPVAGQKVQASSGPGAEPISEDPAVSDERGNFQVTFVCEGAACNGAFWVWLVNDADEQVSPFVEFIFDPQCRRGTVDFSTP